MNKMPDELLHQLPAEWENYDAVLMAWPHDKTDWSYMLDDVRRTFVEIVTALNQDGMKVIIVAPDTGEPSRAMAHLDNRLLYYFNVPTNDTWARDFGVITCRAQNVPTPLLYDYKFNGWGLKFAADKDNLITRAMYDGKVIEGHYVNRLGFVLEGGSIESDGQGTILTTSECLLSLNRNGNLSKEEIECRLKDDFGASRILWLDHGYLAGDDTDSHIDTLARLVSPDTIMYVKCDDKNDEHYEQLMLMEQQLKEFLTPGGGRYNLIGLPLPDAIYDEDGYRLPATYANFLITPHSVLLPIYGQPAKDRVARQMMKIVYPDRQIHCVDCRSLIRQHGSLHCMTMQLPVFLH
ncbi:MAG: agmatine deiminase family protein [Clostridiales bacterium]|nr:agmatine deiminase family protein [Clostridiales bacterium]